MPAKDRAVRLATQRRYRERNYLRVREAEKRYKASAKGKANDRKYQILYRQKPIGKAATRRTYLKAYRKWLKTPAGKRYTARNNLRLPASAPASLVRAIRLLGALKEEIRNREYI